MLHGAEKEPINPRTTTVRESFLTISLKKNGMTSRVAVNISKMAAWGGRSKGVSPREHLRLRQDKYQ